MAAYIELGKLFPAFLVHGNVLVDKLTAPGDERKQAWRFALCSVKSGY